MMKILQSEKGNTLLIAVFVLVLASVIGVSLISMTLNGVSQNKTREEVNQARQEAEKGITYISNLIDKKIEASIPSPEISLSNVKNKFKTNLKNQLQQYYCSNTGSIISYQDDPHHKYEVCLDDLNDQDLHNNPIKLTFISTGYADDKKEVIKSTFELQLEYKNYPQALQYAVATHSEGNLMLNGGIDIKGNVLADGNVIISKYGYAPVADFNKGNKIFWKQSTFPEINGVSSDPATIKINNAKKLFIENVPNFFGGCTKYNGLIIKIPEIFTFNELKNYDFHNTNNLTSCLFQIKNLSQLSSKAYLNYDKTPILESTSKKEPINIVQIIKEGQKNLSSVNKGAYTKELSELKTNDATTPTILNKMYQTLFNMNHIILKGSYKIPSDVITYLRNSTLDGDFYFDGTNLNLASGSNNTLKGRFYVGNQKYVNINGGQQVLDGEFFIDRTSTNATNKGLVEKLKDGFDNALEIDNGTHTIKGIYYLNGDLQIKSSTIKADAVFYVNGDVQIKHSTIESLNGGKLIIIANGDIVYQYASELGDNLFKEYFNEEPVQLDAFLYSNKNIELHGTLSNIYLKGGLSARQILLSGVRGTVEDKVLFFDFKNSDNLNTNSRLRIEYDENVIKTIQSIAENYPSTVTYYELVVQPLHQVSRNFQ